MIAIIPARGGSKGLPGKNIKILKDKPLLVYTIEEAQKSKNIDRIILSTDSPEIAEVGIKSGAEVPFLRPDDLAQDDTKAIDVYLYTVNRLEKESKNVIDFFSVLLPTAPLRLAFDIDSAFNLFADRNADSVVSYTEEHHPISWHKYLDDDNRLENIFEENLSNRQELKKSYYPNGSIYIFRKALLKSGKYYSENSYAYLMPRERSVDIDTIDDFLYAEFLLNRRR